VVAPAPQWPQFQVGVPPVGPGWLQQALELIAEYD
jgi:hypothetical protein